MPLITQELVSILRKQFRLDWRGIHGAPHWARVRANGLRLARLTGANPRVVEYFAFLHDACREDDHRDPGHGDRASHLVYALRPHLALDRGELNDLMEACELHSEGHTHSFNTTILTCWDADRLDLARVGITPHPSRLCTDAARDPGMIRWAVDGSLRRPR